MMNLKKNCTNSFMAKMGVKFLPFCFFNVARFLPVEKVSFHNQKVTKHFHDNEIRTVRPITFNKLVYRTHVRQAFFEYKSCEERRKLQPKNIP